ncbi:TetR family transcriptional regulator C-terminal domain-containing protein [Alkalihalobacillus sp. MEB130]|uniref:TetR/AcrR family transcriptional regulator n=1 Tax=Alkalihalobacillus sp. MEB130 TaxID=2976704 RepID=UPI0028E09377|nr:TetR/AcrR family transcriptional regulator [Alkalihalobacillus sp. MEB130]MDT8862115.1 TetR family transcriptional regulator C-terminal domain-containing protein [Alkalihalobacillus sp. MEB130]
MPKIVDHAERKEQIVEATFRIIHYYGFEKTTLREIAKEAELSLGSVQHFFPKQKDIYLYAMDVMYQRFGERMQKVVQVDNGVFENAVRTVKQLVQVNTEEERIENDIWVKFSIMATMNPEYQEQHKGFRNVHLNFAKDLIRTLHNNGYMKTSTNMEESANSLMIFIHGLVFESVIYAHLYNDQVVEKEIRDYLHKICNENQ